MIEWWVVNAAEAPWGDYGDVLVSGFTTRLEDGALAIERTGPFVPPVTVVGGTDLLVTDDFRSELERSGVVGLAFRETVKRRIVRLDWRRWDLTAPEPERHPRDWEPESYIVGRRHDAALADEIGRIWEVAIDQRADPGSDGITRARSGRILVSSAGREWLARHADEWLRFELA